MHFFVYFTNFIGMATTSVVPTYSHLYHSQQLQTHLFCSTHNETNLSLVQIPNQQLVGLHH